MKLFASKLTAGSLLAAAMIFNPSAHAQGNFPGQPIKIVMPVPAGSALDIVARIVAEPIGKELGQAVVIENRPGGGGLLAAQAVSTASADGHTLLGGASSVFTILPAQKDKLPIDPNHDLIQIGMLLSAPMYLAVSPKLNVNSAAEFFALAKSEPQKFVIGTNSAGTLPHYAAVALAKRAGISVVVLPYNSGGTSEAIKDIVGGRVHATVEAYAGLRGAVQSGDLKLIGVMGNAREPQHKDLPTLTETLSGFTAVGFMTLAAPAGTPAPIIERVNLALNKTLRDPAVSQKLTDLGMPPRIMSSAETKAFVEAEQKAWGTIVRETAAN